MANTVTHPRDIRGLAGPAGSTVVQVSDMQRTHLVLDTVGTSESSIAILNTSVWREGILLINVSAIAGTTPQLIFNVWQLDNAGNRYPAPAAAPANNGFVNRTISTVTRTRDVISSSATAVTPIGATIEITFNTGTSSGAFAATVDIEVQLKSA